jgi:DNA modification methylase
MSDKTTQQKTYVNGTTPHDTEEVTLFSSEHLAAALEQLRAADTLENVRRVVSELIAALHAPDSRLRSEGDDEQSIGLSLKHLTSELEQIRKTRTLERARYYIGRLFKSIGEPKTNGINDINLNRWKEYEDIYTESLWIEKRRDKSGAHIADYWGNFIPQIPHQMMRRYTRRGEWVLDTFAGSGTTLIEGQRLGRNTLGVELDAEIAEKARQRYRSELNLYGVTCEVVTGDSTAFDYAALLAQHGQRSVQLVIMHPPYFDIIKFSEDQRDLSNAASVSDFLARMGQSVENVAPVLDQGRYLVLVIGDKYAEGEWIPLGFQTMQEVTQRGFTLKSIIVKNFEETTGKRKQQQLWRYRALRNGFYIFKHEYIFLFQKQ